MGRRVTLSGVLFLTLIMVNLTSFEDKYERHVGRCDWVCNIDDLNFGEELKTFKGQGASIEANVRYYPQNRVVKPHVNNSSHMSAKVWMTLRTDNVKTGLQSSGSVQLVNETLMQIDLSGQLTSREYRKMAFSCIKRSKNFLLDYIRGFNDSVCARHQAPMLRVDAEDLSNYTNLISFFGYLWTDKNSRVLVGFVNSKHDKHSEKRHSCEWVFYPICTVFILYYPAILALFCKTDITVPVRRVVRADMGCTENLENPEGSSRKSLTGRRSRQDSTNEDDDRNFICQEEDRMPAHLMNINGLNPMGFRSIIARNVFSNTGKHDKCRKSVKVVVLALFPLTIPLLLDLYSLTMPKVMSRVALSLPSNNFSKSVFKTVYKKCPYMLIFFFLYVVRCICLCFTPATSIWVPSFVCRKHLRCAIYNNYCVKLLLMCFPRCNAFLSSACDECKRTSDCPKQCEVPENIKHNLQVQTQTFVKHWDYVYHDVFKKHLLQPVREQAFSFLWLAIIIIRVIFFPLSIVILVGQYVLLVLTDFIFSSPIISMCYGRIWVTSEWLEYMPQFHYRIIRFVCHVLEFLLICGSVAWVAYFSYCTSLVAEIIVRGVMNILVSYPVTTVKYAIIDISFLHSLWSCYKSFIGKYNDLILELYKSYKESYKNINDKLINWQQGYTYIIPKDLFDKAYKKHMPLDVLNLIFWIAIISILWVILRAALVEIERTTAGLSNFALIAFCSLISLAHPWVIGVIRKKKKTEEIVLEEVSANVVKDYVTDLMI